jgi:hypothetical protein
MLGPGGFLNLPNMLLLVKVELSELGRVAGRHP